MDMSKAKEAYEAMGYIVNEEANTLSMKEGSNPSPFQMIVTAYPIGMIMDERHTEPIMQFGLLVDDTISFEEIPYQGHRVHNHQFEGQIEIPVDQVRVYKEPNA